MQGWKDRIGADLAVVSGTIIEGVPVYRMVLLQAKMEKPRGSANVSQRGGEQLRELLGSGMGFYLFYPAVFQNRVFLPTVRSAEDVSRDVHSGKGPNYRVDVCRGDGGEPAWDFPAFLAIAMASPDPGGPGRIFPDVSSVCRVLSEGRKKPLTQEVAFFDTTGALNVLDFVEGLRSLGYRSHGVFSSPAPGTASDLDLEPPPDVDGAPGGPGFRP